VNDFNKLLSLLLEGNTPQIRHWNTYIMGRLIRASGSTNIIMMRVGK